jgi:hypothetical protein
MAIIKAEKIMIPKFEELLGELKWGKNGRVFTEKGDFKTNPNAWEAVGIFVKLHLNTLRWLLRKKTWQIREQDLRTGVERQFGLMLPEFQLSDNTIIGIRDPARSFRMFRNAESFESAIDDGGDRYKLDFQYSMWGDDLFAFLMTCQYQTPVAYMPPPLLPVGFPLQVPPEYQRPRAVPKFEPLWQILAWFNPIAEQRGELFIRRRSRGIRVIDYPLVYNPRKIERKGDLRWYTEVGWHIATDEFMMELETAFVEEEEIQSFERQWNPIDVEVWAMGQKLQRWQRGIEEEKKLFYLTSE